MSSTEFMAFRQTQPASAYPIYGSVAYPTSAIQPGNPTWNPTVIQPSWWPQTQELGETGESLANTSTSTTSTASPPPIDQSELPKSVEDQSNHANALYASHHVYSHPYAQHIQYPHQQAIQGLPGISSLAWQGDQDEWRRQMNPTMNELTGKTRTRDKYRVVYSNFQRLELEKEYRYNKYITIRRKAELAKQLGLSERQVKIWFQNRRAKERKLNKRSDSPIQEEIVSEESGAHSDSSQNGEVGHIIVGQPDVGQVQFADSAHHTELDSVNQVITSLSDEENAVQPTETHEAPAIQSIVQTLVGCTEKYLGDSVKYEVN